MRYDSSGGELSILEPCQAKLLCLYCTCPNPRGLPLGIRVERLSEEALRHLDLEGLCPGMSLQFSSALWW